jgi:hypothetical protein
MYALASQGYHDGSMRTQALLLTVPSVAMAVVGFAMFGPGAVQPFDGARIWGGPYSWDRHLSWRITVLQRFRGIDSTRHIGAIVVRAQDGAGQISAAYRDVSDDGTCDVMMDFSSNVKGPVHAVVTVKATGAMLAEGDVFGDVPGWGKNPGHPSLLEGSTHGDLAIEVRARRGIFAAPFRDELTVSVRDGEAPMEKVQVTLSSDAADVDDGTNQKSDTTVSPGGGIADAASLVTRLTGSTGEATFGVTPRSHAVDVDIDVTAPDRSATWHGVLPVVPGAMWLDPAPIASNTIRVVSPVPRDFAYATMASSQGRSWGGTIPLTPDARGFSSGQVQGPAPKMYSEHGPAVVELEWLTLASDPLASGAGTVGWPVPGREVRAERPFRDQLLVDGMSAAEKRNDDRRYRARKLSALALGAAAVLEGVLLARDSGARTLRAWAWTAIAIATVALAFAAIGVVVMWKTSG